MNEHEWPAATVQYRLNLPHALHSISPAISALHISRVMALHPEISAVLHPSHCPKCGTYHFSGDHPSSLVGPSKKKKRRRATSSRSKSLQRRCRLCGFSIDARASPSHDHASMPNIPRAKEIGQDTPPGHVSRPTAGTVQTTERAPVPPSHPKPSHTKTSTLKDMLSRDRQREEVVKSQKKKKEGREGLAAFLKEL
ncbi:hypothetical protein V8E55_001697 [Tylopilus felleus]